ncbi:MAG: DUF1622 domain-containing protein [Acidimicrobiales bacterium]
MEFGETMETIARVFEGVGVVVIVVGGLVALAGGFREYRDPNRFFKDVRRSFGQPLILGLEILVAADIIKTITVDPSFVSVGVLGILVVVRIALSFSLDIEVDGMVPWRRYEMEGRAGRASPTRTDET